MYFEITKFNAFEVELSKSKFQPENCSSCPERLNFEAITNQYKRENSNVTSSRKKIGVASHEQANKRIECNLLPIWKRFAKGWVHTIRKNKYRCVHT